MSRQKINELKIHGKYKIITRECKHGSMPSAIWKENKILGNKWKPFKGIRESFK